MSLLQAIYGAKCNYCLNFVWFVFLRVNWSLRQRELWTCESDIYVKLCVWVLFVPAGLTVLYVCASNRFVCLSAGHFMCLCGRRLCVSVRLTTYHFVYLQVGPLCVSVGLTLCVSVGLAHIVCVSLRPLCVCCCDHFVCLWSYPFVCLLVWGLCVSVVWPLCVSVGLRRLLCASVVWLLCVFAGLRPLYVSGLTTLCVCMSNDCVLVIRQFIPWLEITLPVGIDLA